jgi:hypothetical protein
MVGPVRWRHMERKLSTMAASRPGAGDRHERTDARWWGSGKEEVERRDILYIKARTMNKETAAVTRRGG